MPEIIPCVEYDPLNNRCISGFPVTHTICRGGPAGCHACGTPGTMPMCMREDLPAHLMRDDGMPIGWPIR
jgi:hypothetical protein